METGFTKKALSTTRSFFRNISNFVKYEIFSKEYFEFILNLNLKKKSIYINLIVYSLIVITCTIIAPLIVNFQPILFLSYPVLSLILVLIIAIIASYITVEIFRTPIDDGTELMTLSKPLHRSQIFFCKCLVLTIIGSTMAVFGAMISSISLTFNTIDKIDQLKVIVGTLVATVVCFAVFGSLTILFSLFSNKIISLLLSTGLAFLLVIVSILSSLTMDSKTDIVTSVTNFSSNTSQIGYLNIDKKGNASAVQGYIPNKAYSDANSSEVKTAESYYQDDYNSKTYPKFAPLDLGQQLSSMFTLTMAPKDTFAKMKIMDIMKSPYKLKFNPIETFQNFTGTSLKVTYPTQNLNSSEMEDKTQYLLYVPTYTSSIWSMSGENWYGTNLQYTSYDYSNQRLADSNKEFLYFEKLIYNNFATRWSQTDWENVSTAENTTIKFLDYANKFFEMTNNIAQDVVGDYFNKYNFASNKQRTQSINELNQIIYTGIYEYFVKDLNGSLSIRTLINEFEEAIKLIQEDPTNTKQLEKLGQKYIQEIVILRLMYLDLQKGTAALLKTQINSDNKNGTTSTIEEYITTFMTAAFVDQGITFNIDNNSNDLITNSNGKLQYSFQSTYRIAPSSSFANFQEAHVVSMYNPYVLFSSWLVFSVVITLAALIIYRQRDFK